jgi:hypothetical protein
LDVPISQLRRFRPHSGTSHALGNIASVIDAKFSPEELPERLLRLKG